MPGVGLTITITTVLLIAALVANAEFAAVREGDKTPAFEIKAFDGSRILTVPCTSAKPAVIVFWATWCPACRAEIPGIESLYKDYKAKGIEFVAVSLDRNRDELARFLKINGITIPVGYDGERGSEIALRFGLKGIPTTFVLDTEGKARAIFVGKSSLSMSTTYAGAGWAGICDEIIIWAQAAIGSLPCSAQVAKTLISLVLV